MHWHRPLLVSLSATKATRADAIHCWQIELEPTSCVFAAGDAIRLEIASSAFPFVRPQSIHRSEALAGRFVELAALYSDGAA